MEYAEIIEAIGREAADLPPGRALDADAVAHLAQTFEPLVAEAQQRFLDIMPADEFWRRVGQRLGLDQTAARPVTEAVLETLAERVAADVVEDLVARLDPLLHPPLRRGIASSGPAARRMPLARCCAGPGGKARTWTRPGWWTWYSSMSGRCSRRWPRRLTPRSDST
jgi:hypothetical protein